MTHSIEALAVYLVDAQKELEEAQAHVDFLKEQIRTHPDIHGPDTYAAGNLTIQVQPNTRFDQALAEKAIPADLLPLVTVVKSTVSIDRKKVEVLAPNFVEACIAHYPDKVVVK